VEKNIQIKHIVREETRFAGIRRPIKSRDELIPRIEKTREACEGLIAGPLTHIFRFDTPVDGFDSEIGYPVTSEVNTGEVKTHTLRRLHFFSLTHMGPVETIRNTTSELVNHLNKVGLASELELVEIYHRFETENQEQNIIEIQVSFLAWPEVYREQLLRVLGTERTAIIWAGGEEITPFTLVDDRATWVATSLERLKADTNPDQQFDILSRVALVRPVEDTNKYKRLYEETGSVTAILEDQNEQLESGPTGGFIDPPRLEGNILHLSKVAYNRAAYDEATTPEATRKAYCFCTLIREAKDPKVDPIFCYRAAGWARQFWEPILETEFRTCRITHSILKGDKFCAWDYVLEEGWDR
jgi:effector-binding domain-containing protein